MPDDARRRQLEDWLRREPADPDERAHAAAMRELLASAGDPFARDRFDPGHVTASAFVLAPDGPELALVLHVALERWLQPGGHVEPGDVDLVEAARRELREELGLDGIGPLGPTPLDLDVHRIPARGGAPAHRHYDVRLLFRARHRRLAAGDGVREARWVSPARVAALGDRSMRRVVAKIVDCGSSLDTGERR